MKRINLFSQKQLLSLMAHEKILSLFVALAIGMAAGLGAMGFRLMIKFFAEIFAKFPQWAEQLLGFGWIGVLLAPAAGGLIIGPLIFRFAKEARGHGVPEVMAAVIQKGGYIRPRIVWIKALASAICIGSGGSVGREGPIIQIGSSIGSMLGFVLHMPPRLMRTYVACGAAAGIAATFNAPIAGSLFAVEIILGDFGFVSLAPIVTSSVVATVISRGIEGDLSSFHVPAYTLASPVELVFYLGLGLLCGVAAPIFISTLDFLEDIFEKHVKVHDGIKPALGGLLVGLVGLWFPQIFGVGYPTIDLALLGNIPFYLLVALAVFKLLATALTLSSGGSGGVFAPSLFIGSMLGGIVGKVANFIAPALTASSGAYALVGMAAMVGAATHAPITAIVMIFELTNDYKIILPLMISTIIAVLTANALHKESIYTHKLKRKGIDPHSGIEENLLKKMRVKDIMREEFEKAPEDLPFNFLVDLLLQTARSQIPVVGREERLVGMVSRDVAQKFLLDRSLLSDMVIARDVANKECPTALPDETLDHAALLFQEYKCREIYVLDDKENRRVIGMVRKGDLMDAYQTEMNKQQSGDSFAYGINHPHRMESVDVMDGYSIIEIEAPHEYSGKLLRELDLRQRHGMNVLAIKRAAIQDDRATKRVWVPESGDRIMDGDILVLLGKTEDIAKFQKLA